MLSQEALKNKQTGHDVFGCSLVAQTNTEKAESQATSCTVLQYCRNLLYYNSHQAFHSVVVLRTTAVEKLFINAIILFCGWFPYDDEFCAVLADAKYGFIFD